MRSACARCGKHVPSGPARILLTGDVDGLSVFTASAAGAELVCPSADEIACLLRVLDGLTVEDAAEALTRLTERLGRGVAIPVRGLKIAL